jgi:tRNA threonylcarbamoyl adenosine modification protein YeaZ
MLLAIDTSAGSSVAVVDRDRGVISERGTDDTMRHAEVIGVLIREALDDAEVAPSALSAVAIGMGPGPFTGLRVGIAAGRAFALGAGIRAVSLVSHDAIAFAHYAGAYASGPLLVVTDARRRELYWSLYEGADPHGLPIRREGPGLAKPDDVPTGVTRLDAAVVSAGQLGMLAELSYLHGREFAADTPLYLRSPDVTLSSGPKRVSQR